MQSTVRFLVGPYMLIDALIQGSNSGIVARRSVACSYSFHISLAGEKGSEPTGGWPLLLIELRADYLFLI